MRKKFAFLYSLYLFVGLVAPLIFGVANVSAAPCTVNNAPYASGVIGDCIGQQPHEDAVVLEYNRDSKLGVQQNITAGTGFEGIWQDITFKGTSQAKPTVEIFSVSDSTFLPDGQKKTITSPKITLENINLDTDVRFWFGQPNNEFIFKNSSIRWGGYEPIFFSGTHTNIISDSGVNQWVGLSRGRIPANITLDIKSGSSFEFYSVGASGPGEFTRFSGDTDVNVKTGGVLKFRSSIIDFYNASVFTVDNGGAIEISEGSAISVALLNLNQGTLSFGAGSNTFTTTISNILSGTLNINASTYKTKFLNLSGNSTITGSQTSDGFYAELLRTRSIFEPTTLNVNGLNQLIPEALFLTNNLTINLDESTLLMKSGSELTLDGGTINMNSARGILSVDGGSIIGNSANLNVNGGALSIGGGAELSLAPRLNVTLAGGTSRLEVQGKLTGSGVIAGSGGNIIIGSDIITGGKYLSGILSPGTAASPFGTITINHGLTYRGLLYTTSQPLIDTGLLDRGYYDVDIGMTGGTVPINDKLVYGNGVVDLTLLKALRVDVADNSTASQLNRQSFRIIEASGAGVAGTIFMRGQNIGTDLKIEEGPNVPVLIDFFVANDNTYGEDDLTLYAEYQSPITLQKHPGVATYRNTQAVAAILPASATSSSSQTPAQQVAQQTVFTALQSTTNSQVTSHFSSIHPEPISSYMTVQIEQADNMLNTVLSVNSVSKSPENEKKMLGSYFFGSSKARNSGMWANINYIDGSVNGQDDLGSFYYYLSSTTFGGEILSTNSYGLGAFFGYSKQVMHEHDRANMNFDTDAYHLGLYGNALLNEKTSINWALGHGWLSTNSHRKTSLGSVYETATGEYDSQLSYMGVRLKYDISWMEGIESNIYGGLAYLRNDQEAFKEKNAPNLGLSIDRAIVHSEIVSAGAELKWAVNAAQRTLLLAGVRYDYDVQADKNSEHDINAAFNFSPSSKQSFVGQNRGAHAVTLELGVDHKFVKDGLFSIRSTYTHSSHGKEFGADITINWRW